MVIISITIIMLHRHQDSSSNARMFSSCCVWSFEIFIELPYQNVTHGNLLPGTPTCFYPF